MAEISAALRTAFALLVGWDPELAEIVWLSLQVSLAALALAAGLGLPLGAWLGIAAFPGRRAVVAISNALFGLPAVVVGLVVYMLLSRAGPLGELGLLFSPAAMVIAQTVLITPLVIALTRQLVEDLHSEYGEQLRAHGAGTGRAVPTLLYEGRFALATVLLAAFGRAVSAVGAVVIVGGNIAHVTRVMSTAIALETSRGELALALGLGILLLGISLAVAALAEVAREVARRVGA